MQTRIEPPILLSRMLMFVFAGTVVVLFVLFMTLGNMFPLDRPEVFIVSTKPTGDTVITISEMIPEESADSLKLYEQAFVMEYIRARNQIENNIALMRQKWKPRDGVVAIWSTRDVYANFKKTSMYNAIMKDVPEFKLECPVTILGRPEQYSANTYTVRMRYYCKDGNDQTTQKDYRIRVGLVMADNARIPWKERMDNPLGLQISEYAIESGGGDPLDTVYNP